MGFSMPPVLTIVGMVLAAVALLLQIVGVATTGWVVADNIDSESGLFKACGLGICVDLDNVDDWYDACRAFGILAVLLLIGCLLVAVVTCFMQIDKVPLPLIAAILAFVAAFCCLIEFAVFAGESTVPDGFSLGYSFALTIVACLLAVGAGVCLVMGKNKS